MLLFSLYFRKSFWSLSGELSVEVKIRGREIKKVVVVEVWGIVDR